MLSIKLQHKPRLHELTSYTAGGNNKFRVAMDLEFFSYWIFEHRYSYNYTAYDALSNETKLSLLTAMAWETLAPPSFFKRFKNLKIDISREN